MRGGPRGDRTKPTDKKAEEARRKREQARKIAEARREKAERKRVPHPQDGAGFQFDADKPAAGEMDRWYKGLSNKQKEALKSQNTEVTITASASRAGSAKYNLDLSKRRGDNVAKILKEKYNVSAKIKVEAMGEEPAEMRKAPDQKDDHTDRVAIIRILPGTDKPAESKDKVKTFDEALKRAKDILSKRKPKEARVAKRLDGLLKKISDSSVDDSFIPGRIIFHQDQPHLRPPLQNVIEHARPKLRKLMSDPVLIHRGKGKYERMPASDDVLRSRLERLDAEIASGPQMAARQIGIQGPTASSWLRKANDWIAERQQRPTSILSVYAERI